MGTTFTSVVMQEFCRLPQVNLDFTTVKHPQTIGSIECTHASLKRYQGIHENQIKRDWHNYVDLAVLYTTLLTAPPSDAPRSFCSTADNPLVLCFNNILLPNLET